MDYPDQLEAGLRVDRCGNSSAQYSIGIFRQGDTEAATHGHLVQVFVDRAANKSVALPAGVRSALGKNLDLNGRSSSGPQGNS